MGFRTLLKKTQDKLKKLKHTSAHSKDSGLTVDDPTSPPRPRSLASRSKDTIANFPELRASNETKKRSRAGRLLSTLRKNKSLKSKAVVGPPVISHVPATITRCRPALSIIIETEVEVEEGNTNTEPDRVEEITSNQTIITEPAHEQDDGGHSGHSGDQSGEETRPSEEASPIVTARNQQLVLASFFDARPLKELHVIHSLSEVPEMLPAAVVEPALNITLRVPVERATLRCQNKIPSTYIPHIEPLDAQTGAVVLYHSKSLQRDPHQLQQAVEELSEHPDSIESWSFEEASHVGYPAKLVPDLEHVSDNEVSYIFEQREERADPDDGETSDISSESTTPSVDEDTDVVQSLKTSAGDSAHREILRLKAAHRVEVARLKESNRENLEICANDLGEQQKKTQRANQRAARSLKQLNASRKERQDLGERLQPVELLHARIAELEAQPSKDGAQIDYLLDEGFKLQRKVQEQQEIIELLQGEQEKVTGLRKERDQLLTRCQRLFRDEVNPRQDLIDSMEAQINGLNHQMGQSVKGYQDMYANFVDVSEQLERQKVLNKALNEQRVTRFIERPASRENWNVLRPDELVDAQQALLVSQENHRKEVQRSEELVKEIESKEELLDDLTEQFRSAKKQIKALRSYKTLTTDVRRAHENTFLAFAAEDASDDSPALKAAAAEVIAKEQAMTQKMVDLALENVNLKEDG